MSKKKSGTRVAPREPSLGFTGAPVHFAGSVDQAEFTQTIGSIESRIAKLEETVNRWDRIIERQNRGVSEVLAHFEDLLGRVDELENMVRNHMHGVRSGFAMINGNPIAVVNAEPVHTETEPSEPMVEIGGQRMTQAQFDAARYSLLHPTPGDIDEAGPTPGDN